MSATETQPVTAAELSPSLVQTIISKRGDKFELHAVYDMPKAGIIGEPYSKVLVHSGTLPQCLGEQQNILTQNWGLDPDAELATAYSDYDVLLKKFYALQAELDHRSKQLEAARKGINPMRA